MEPQPISTLGCLTAETNASISPWLHVACTGGLFLISARSRWQEPLERRWSSNCYSCLSSSTCAHIFLRLFPFGLKFSMFRVHPVMVFCWRYRQCWLESSLWSSLLITAPWWMSVFHVWGDVKLKKIFRGWSLIYLLVYLFGKVTWKFTFQSTGT